MRKYSGWPITGAHPMSAAAPEEFIEQLCRSRHRFAVDRPRWLSMDEDIFRNSLQSVERIQYETESLNTNFRRQGYS